MKIAFINHNPYPSTMGGTRTHIMELSKVLEKRGHTVHVITTKKEDYKKYSDYKSLFSKMLYVIWRIGFIIKFIYSARKKQEIEEYDLVMAQDPMEDSFAARSPFVISMHGIYHKGMKLMRGNIMAFLSNIISWVNMKRASKVMCINKESAEYYDKSVYIPNGVDINKFIPGEKEKKSILFVGRLSPEKNVDKLISAMDYLPGFKLTIIGDGELREEVIRLCKGKKNCIYIGEVEHDSLPDYYSKSEYLCQPSKFEGLSFVLLEGMASGCIPVVSDVGGTKFIVNGATGVKIKNHNDPKSIANAIRNADNYIGRNARTYVEYYHSWDNIAGMVEVLMK